MNRLTCKVDTSIVLCSHSSCFVGFGLIEFSKLILRCGGDAIQAFDFAIYCLISVFQFGLLTTVRVMFA